MNLDAPRRIQRHRIRGWRMPANTVYVGRPTKWGNPYCDVQRYGLELCLKMFSDTSRGHWNPGHIPNSSLATSWIRWLYDDHSRWLKRIGGQPSEVIQQELRGKNLACWCALNQSCHADILLEIANG
jgi:hypothetical protein